MGKVLVDGGFVSKSILPGSSRRGEVARERGGGGIVYVVCRAKLRVLSGAERESRATLCMSLPAPAKC